MPRLILIRHGESAWNRDNLFTGWADVDLTPVGEQQMRDAGNLLRREGITFDVAFTSMLRRCIRSQWALLDAMDRVWVPVVSDWRLNERHYGALTGLSKAQAVVVHGPQAVHGWRRSFHVSPPEQTRPGPGHAASDGRYRFVAPGDLPRGESLAQVVTRVRPIWENEIGAVLRSGRDVGVVGHGNSLRALVKLIEGLDDDEIVDREVENAAPLVYELSSDLALRGCRQFDASISTPSEIL